MDQALQKEYAAFKRRSAAISVVEKVSKLDQPKEAKIRVSKPKKKKSKFSRPKPQLLTGWSGWGHNQNLLYIKIVFPIRSCIYLALCLMN